MINSVSIGYFVVNKRDIIANDLQPIFAELQGLGFNVLTNNREILFCKHNNPQMPAEDVAKHYANVFGLQPVVYSELQRFFIENNL